jgi:hypothetical protein
MLQPFTDITNRGSLELDDEARLAKRLCKPVGLQRTTIQITHVEN